MDAADTNGQDPRREERIITMPISFKFITTTLISINSWCIIKLSSERVIKKGSRVEISDWTSKIILFHIFKGSRLKVISRN